MTVKLNEVPTISEFWSIDQLPNYRFDAWSVRSTVMDLIGAGMSEITVRKVHAIEPNDPIEDTPIAELSTGKEVLPEDESQSEADSHA